MYDKVFIEEALSVMWIPDAVVQMAREPGMPSGASDPRKAQNPQVMMIDVRRAWSLCDWLSLDERRALFAYAICGTRDAAAEMLGVSGRTQSVRHERGLELLQLFLESTVAEREQWGRDLEDYARYGRLNAVRENEVRLLAGAQ